MSNDSISNNTCSSITNQSTEDLISNLLTNDQENNINNNTLELKIEEIERANASPNNANTSNNSTEDLLNTAASPNNQNGSLDLNQAQENGDTNRKRKYDDHLNDRDNSTGYNNKRNNSNRKSNSHNNSSTSGDEDVYLKLLIPSSAAGGVIGRGGEKIAQIQKDANVRMKMSKANDYYPNTNERVCLIIGSVKAVLKAHEYIIERIQEKSDSKSQSSTDEERYNQIKILIPNTTAGLLIGKGGTYIKQIKDDSGAFVQISSKQTDLPERIVTIDGDADTRNKALNLVVKKISEDPQHNSVTNLNYSSSNTASIDSNYANNTNNMNNNQGNINKYDFNSAAVYLAGLNNLALLIVNCGGSFAMTADSLKLSLRNLGYNTSATMEIIEAITVLMSYGLISKIPPAGANNTANFNGIANLANNLGGGHNMNNSNSGGFSGHPHSQHNDNRNNSNSHPSHMQHHQHHYPHNNNNNHHHYNNNSSNMNNGSGMNNPNNNNAVNMGNVLQILSNTLGKQRPNKF